MKRFLTICRMGALAGVLSIIAVGQAAAETPEQFAARIAWWRDAQFGMFVHWGLYAIPAGTWNGIPYLNTSEWIMAAANIPREQYETLVDHFNPQEFDAAEWVRTAKDAGMRYLIITAKHHDGFSMWPTKVRDRNNRVPYFLKRDVLKKLANECAKQGIRFGVYYSILDWHHSAFKFPDDVTAWGGDAQDCSGEWCYTIKGLPDATKPIYVSYMYAQLRELIENYHPSVIWFDGNWFKNWTSCDGNALYGYVRMLKPDVIINDRATSSNGDCPQLDTGDYTDKFEPYIPETDPGCCWETPMQMNGNWGYNSGDERWKSSETLINALTEIKSKNGNYLLNVGPDENGIIPQASIERLNLMGK